MDAGECRLRIKVGETNKDVTFRPQEKVLALKTRSFPGEAGTVRLFFAGRELRDADSCGEAGLKEGSVAHAMKRQATASRGSDRGPSESGPASLEGHALFMLAGALLGGAWYISTGHQEFFGTPSFIMLGGLTLVFFVISIQTLFKQGSSSSSS